MIADNLNNTFIDHIADILIVVSDVGAGDYGARLKPSNLPLDHPVSALYEGVNQMIASLESAQQRGEAYRKELEEKLATIEVQRAAIRELSTPIIEMWVGVLCLPLVGVLDTTRSAEMTEALLAAIVEKKASRAIIDITGIQVMDTATADHFLRMTKAVRLLGASCVLTGVHPNIAQTIVNMGVDLSEVRTHRTLRSALEEIMGTTSADD